MQDAVCRTAVWWTALPAAMDCSPAHDPHFRCEVAVDELERLPVVVAVQDVSQLQEFVIVQTAVFADITRDERFVSIQVIGDKQRVVQLRYQINTTGNRKMI